MIFKRKKKQLDGVALHAKNMQVYRIVRFKKLHESAVAPTYGSACAAGADIRALLDEPITINPHETAFVHTGIAVSIPDGLVGLIYARSGIACKRGLAPANMVGVIDSDYRGEIMVALHNYGSNPQVVEPNERIAQMVVSSYAPCAYIETTELDATVRGAGGFGSTGKM